LRSEESGQDVSLKHQSTFNQALKRYNSGELPNNGSKRNRPSPYEDVKEKVLEYIEFQARLYKRDKCGLSWALLKHKSLVFAEQLGHDVNNLRPVIISFPPSSEKVTRRAKNYMVRGWI
jgi:hypothetical protein